MTRSLCTVLALTGGLLLAGGAASAQAPLQRLPRDQAHLARSRAKPNWAT